MDLEILKLKNLEGCFKVLGKIPEKGIYHVYDPKVGDIIQISKNNSSKVYIEYLKHIINISSIPSVIFVNLECDQYSIYKIQPYHFQEIARSSYSINHNYKSQSFKNFRFYL
jgi:stalled ribosome rescue protein Dom34